MKSKIKYYVDDYKGTLYLMETLRAEEKMKGGCIRVYPAPKGGTAKEQEERFIRLKEKAEARAEELNLAAEKAAQK